MLLPWVIVGDCYLVKLLPSIIQDLVMVCTSACFKFLIIYTYTSKCKYLSPFELLVPCVKLSWKKHYM
ncbi:hypothetical protein XELAEV_18041072mg [Xenopus laevis]|uniref:Uncharacterized protein n=1 Tax=Xenopus laevis TaxID=8355 RepID=A0A974H4S2_XENLA|nr:hypothetical protein XELAEV_18041072mg [Xenopus laevis]